MNAVKTELPYLHSLAESFAREEFEVWRESFKLNCDCSDAIEKNILEHFSNNRLDIQVDDLVEQYGVSRIGWVLANTVQMKSYDGRFSQSNKAWAGEYPIPLGDARGHFCVQSHSGLVNLFITEVRKEHPEMEWSSQPNQDMQEEGPSLGGM